MKATFPVNTGACQIVKRWTTVQRYIQWNAPIIIPGKTASGIGGFLSSQAHCITWRPLPVYTRFKRSSGPSADQKLFYDYVMGNKTSHTPKRILNAIQPYEYTYCIISVTCALLCFWFLHLKGPTTSGPSQADKGVHQQAHYSRGGLHGHCHNH